MAVYNNNKITGDLPRLCTFACTLTPKTEANGKENIGVRAATAIFLRLRTRFKESKYNTPPPPPPKTPQKSYQFFFGSLITFFYFI